MSRRKIPSKRALSDALRELDGNMAAVARRFHCHRSLVWLHVNKDPKLRELVDELQESFTDECESQLFKLTATKEHLKASAVIYTARKPKHVNQD